MLHIIKQAPRCAPVLLDYLDILTQGDVLLFIENGVYIVLDPARIHLLTDQKGLILQVLKPDLQARGLDKLATHNQAIKLTDYRGFVHLLSQQDTVQSW